MQSFVSFIVWTLAAVIIAWFLTLSINRYLFYYSNVNTIIQGEIRISDTDIGTQCGSGINPLLMVDYKLTEDGRILFICPQGWWPIQREVITRTISTNFRKRLTQIQRTELNKYYPEVVPTQQMIPAQPMGVNAPPPVINTPVTTEPAQNPQNP